MAGDEARLAGMTGGSARFMRDVAASLVATAIVTGAVAYLKHRPDAPAAEPAPAKLAERLGPAGSEAGDRSLMIFETLALFAPTARDAGIAGQPIASATPVLPAAQATARAPLAARSLDPAPRRFVAALPPSRPADLVTRAAPPERVASAAVEPATASSARREPLRVLGWSVPGSEHMPRPEDLATAAGHLGGQVTSVAANLGGVVGLR